MRLFLLGLTLFLVLLASFLALSPRSPVRSETTKFFLAGLSVALGLLAAMLLLVPGHLLEPTPEFARFCRILQGDSRVTVCTDPQTGNVCYITGGGISCLPSGGPK